MEAGHRLERSCRVFACIERRTTFPHRFRMVPFETECHCKREMWTSGVSGTIRCRPRGLRRRRIACGLVKGKIRFRTRQARIERDCPAVRFPRFVHPPQIAEYEASEIVGVGIRGIEVDRAPQKTERLLTVPAIVMDLGEKEVEHRAVRVVVEGATESLFRLVEVARAFLGDSAFDQRTDVVR